MAQDVPLDIVTRFSTSNPDLILTITSPSTTTSLSLKQQIRSQLAAPANTSRLRLIHAGKVLADTSSLAKSLNVTAPPPNPRNQDGEGKKSETAKGKQPIREAGKSAVPAVRVYIHCSIGDTLSASDLSAEAKAAEEAEKALSSQSSQPSLNTTTHDAAAASTTTPAPRGFDRLLNTGFTPAEVTALRTQFLAIQSHTHTPDTMPTGPDLLALEERWLDDTPSPNNPTDDAGGFGGEDAGGLEDMLWGNLAGFFWPIGAMAWLMREEGVWTRRRQIAVVSGVLVNLTFGFLRVMN